MTTKMVRRSSGEGFLAGRMYALIEVPHSKNLSHMQVLPRIGEESYRRRKKKSRRKNGYINIPTAEDWPDVRIVHMFPTVGRSDDWIHERQHSFDDRFVKRTGDATSNEPDYIKVLGDGKRVSFNDEIVIRYGRLFPQL